MASLPLREWTDNPANASTSVHFSMPADTGSHFSALEWSIVAMAERDSLASLRQPNRFWALIGAVFGLRPANRLANDRLEALRRVAVLAWRHRWNVAPSELRAFFAAGYSQAQYELLQLRVANVRSDRSRRLGR